MKLLVLGRSSIAIRRVLPALAGTEGISAVDLATRRPVPEGFAAPKLRKVYGDYAEALASSDAELVYVSLVNGAHAEWAAAALDAGKHVVVDKPAFVDPAITANMLARAEARNLCLAEATVFTDHPQVARVKSILASTAGIRVVALFSIPPLPADNFRYDAGLGGGTLLDMGPYAAATGRVFFAGAPETVTCRILSRRGGSAVDTAFSLLATYPDGGSLIGHFGFDTEYQNQVTAFGPNAAVTVDRFFTTPPGLENAIGVAEKNWKSTVTVAAADSFGLFFARLADAIGRGDWSAFSDAMERDARFIHAMRQDAKKAVK